MPHQVGTSLLPSLEQPQDVKIPQHGRLQDEVKQAQSRQPQTGHPHDAIQTAQLIDSSMVVAYRLLLDGRQPRRRTRLRRDQIKKGQVVPHLAVTGRDVIEDIMHGTGVSDAEQDIEQQHHQERRTTLIGAEQSKRQSQGRAQADQWQETRMSSVYQEPQFTTGTKCG